MKTMKQMPYHYGIHMRIYPDHRQKRVIRKNSDAARFVYNRCVAVGRELFQLRKTGLFIKTAADRIDFLNEEYCDAKQISNLAPFLYDKEIDCQSKANAVQNYRKAWNQFKKVPGTSIPAFHKKGYVETYQTNAHYAKDDHSVTDGTGVRFLDAEHILLPSIGRIRVKGSGKIIRMLISRDKDTRIGTAAITKEADGNYYVSMQLGSEASFVSVPEKTGKSVGIDVNLANFCADSDGTVIPNPRYKRSIQDRLAKDQKKLSRMAVRAEKENRSLKDSKNYQKQRIRVAKTLKHAAAQHEDFLHCISKRYIENQDVIGIEDLKVKNMLKNHCLAYSISDASWSRFRQFLIYKAELYGKTVIPVPPHFTSQTCSSCGYVLNPEERLTLRDREWDCPQCGTHHLRDNNSAAVIRDRAAYILSALF